MLHLAALQGCKSRARLMAEARRETKLSKPLMEINLLVRSKPGVSAQPLFGSNFL
jgi:hypothetical protein